MTVILTYHFLSDFDSEGGALTLPVEAVVSKGYSWENHELCGRTHANGWTVTGRATTDYYEWVNDFTATHDSLGAVWGNFEDAVRATSKEAYEDFIKHFPPEAWDYHDI